MRSSTLHGRWNWARSTQACHFLTRQEIQLCGSGLLIIAESILTTNWAALWHIEMWSSSADVGRAGMKEYLTTYWESGSRLPASSTWCSAGRRVTSPSWVKYPGLPSTTMLRNGILVVTQTMQEPSVQPWWNHRTGEDAMFEQAGC